MEHNHFDRLGGLLKAARKAKGLTREQLAEILNITPRYLMSIENENKKPSYDVLFRLIRELGNYSSLLLLTLLLTSEA